MLNFSFISIIIKTYREYLFTFLFSDIGQSVLKSKITGQAQGGLNSTNLKDIRIPLMPIDIQIQLVNEVENIENKIKVANEKISEYEEKIKSIASGIKNYSTKFSNIATLEYGKALKYFCKILSSFALRINTCSLTIACSNSKELGIVQTFPVKAPSLQTI